MKNGEEKVTGAVVLTKYHYCENNRMIMFNYRC